MSKSTNLPTTTDELAAFILRTMTGPKGVAIEWSIDDDVLVAKLTGKINALSARVRELEAKLAGKSAPAPADDEPEAKTSRVNPLEIAKPKPETASKIEALKKRQSKKD